MRTLLTILLFGLLFFVAGCSAGKPVSENTDKNVLPEYEIVIRYFDNGSTTDKMMSVFSGKELAITKLEQKYLTSDVHELSVSVTCGNKKIIDDVGKQLSAVVNVESVVAKPVISSSFLILWLLVFE